MSKPAFTSRPWYVETTTASDGECNIVFPQNGNVALSSQYVSREDAHLISAAPDMYEALRQCQEYLKFSLGSTSDINPYPAIEAAFAKAEGRS